MLKIEKALYTCLDCGKKFTSRARVRKEKTGFTRDKSKKPLKCQKCGSLRLDG